MSSGVFYFSNPFKTKSIMLQTTQSTSNFVKYTGIGQYKLISVNPTDAEYEKIYGKAPAKPLIYQEEAEKKKDDGTPAEKVIRWRLNFHFEGLDTGSDIKLGKRSHMIFLFPFTLAGGKGPAPRPRTSSDGKKTQYMNAYGETIWLIRKDDALEIAKGNIPADYNTDPSKVEGTIKAAARFVKVEKPEHKYHIYPCIEGWEQFVNDILRGLLNTGSTFERGNFYFLFEPKEFSKGPMALAKMIMDAYKSTNPDHVKLLTGVDDQGYMKFVDYFIGASQNPMTLVKPAKNGKYYNLGEKLYGERRTKLNWQGSLQLKAFNENLPSPNSNVPSALNATGDSSANDWGTGEEEFAF